jgi:hypothetical protein
MVQIGITKGLLFGKGHPIENDSSLMNAMDIRMREDKPTDSLKLFRCSMQLVTDGSYFHDSFEIHCVQVYCE